jgi:hypothetical protein
MSTPNDLVLTGCIKACPESYNKRQQDIDNEEREPPARSVATMTPRSFMSGHKIVAFHESYRQDDGYSRQRHDSGGGITIRIFRDKYKGN